MTRKISEIWLPLWKMKKLKNNIDSKKMKRQNAILYSGKHILLIEYFSTILFLHLFKWDFLVRKFVISDKFMYNFVKKRTCTSTALQNKEKNKKNKLVCHK